MKLIYAIVSNNDSYALSNALTKAGFFITKLASTGGFLLAGNTTFMIVTDDEKVEEVLEITSQQCKQRKTIAPTTIPYEVIDSINTPIEITVGGATVFVTNVERFEKL